ncbi:MAG: hypothetical protein HYX55_00550 [Chloroflexi bacterium]|nr:hypothetical protein [Chloroflexota bacterium]
MEMFVAIGLAIVVLVVLLRQGRRGSGGPDALTRGLPDDLRDKNTGLGSLPNDGRPWGGGN